MYFICGFICATIKCSVNGTGTYSIQIIECEETQQNCTITIIAMLFDVCGGRFLQ